MYKQCLAQKAVDNTQKNKKKISLPPLCSTIGFSSIEIDISLLTCFCKGFLNV